MYVWCKLWREREKTHMDPAWNSFALIKAYICPWLYMYIAFLMVFVFIPRDWHGTTASDDHWNGRSLISSSKNLKLTIISSRVTCSKVSWGYSPSNPHPKHTGSQVEYKTWETEKPFERENFANFTVLWLFTKVFSANLGTWHLLAAPASNLQSFPVKILFSTMFPAIWYVCMSTFLS